MSYLIPIFAMLRSPMASGEREEGFGSGLRALIVVPTNELAHQIHNECMKLAQGRKWRIILFSKATANTLSTKEVRQKIGIVNSMSLSFTFHQAT
jgi:ATP-dependent RNA helicase DDX52/ROK1